VSNISSVQNLSVRSNKMPEQKPTIWSC